MRRYSVLAVLLLVCFSALVVDAEEAGKPILIGTVQGSFSGNSKEDSARFNSPYVGKVVVVEGIIFQLLADKQNGGFYLQDQKKMADKDKRSSDGIYVYLGSWKELRGNGKSRVPEVGDLVRIRGKVEERYGNTQISKPELVSFEASHKLSELECIEINPPDEMDKHDEYFESIEGMYCSVPKGSVAQSPAKYGNAWFVSAKHKLCKRKERYTNRVFRDAHLLDNNSKKLFDDGNGMRFLLKLDHTSEAQCKTFATTKEELTGSITYSYNNYVFVSSNTVLLDAEADPYENNPPQEIDHSKEFTVASYNLKNFFDYRDDPEDKCDFEGDSGESYIKPPFNWLCESAKAYDEKLSALAVQIEKKLYLPDVIFIQEAEDQDILTIEQGKIIEGRSDGKIDCLQELSLTIEKNCGVKYETCCDRAGAELRGIVSAFLFRTDRVKLAEVTDSSKVMGGKNTTFWDRPLDHNSVTLNPKCFNGFYAQNTQVFARGPQVAHLVLTNDPKGEAELFAICAHFRSTPSEKIEKRRKQAEFCSALSAEIIRAYPKSRVIFGGDLNVYPRPDDPIGKENSDQLKALYNSKLTNLYDGLLESNPSAAYSYVYNGEALTFDQFFVSAGMLERLKWFSIAHINSDYPQRTADGNLCAVSDHDPIVAAFSY